MKVFPSRRPRLLSRLGFFYELSGNLAAGLECYQEARDLDPQGADHYANIARVYEWQNKLDLAAENYERALQLGTRFFDKAFTEELRARVSHLK